MAMARAWASGGRLRSGVRLLSVLPSSCAVPSSSEKLQSAMSPAPTSVTGVVCPKTGTATTTAATHASTTHAAYLAAWLRMSTLLNPVLSMFKGTHSLYLSLVGQRKKGISPLPRYVTDASYACLRGVYVL